MTAVWTRREFLRAIGGGAFSVAASSALIGFTEEGPSDRNVLRTAMYRAGECCLAWLDPGCRYLPTGGYEVAHDTGRWWDAMLRLEAATGFPVPGNLEAAMLVNLQELMGNSDGLLMVSSRIDGANNTPMINPHNFREALLALSALVKYRQNDWARRKGHRLLETMHRCFQDDGRFDYTLLDCWGKVPLSNDPCHSQPTDAAWFDATANSGRALEAMLCFYSCTDDSLAMELAERIASHHLKNSVNSDGTIRGEIVDPENVGHNHSYLGTLRGLLRFGHLTNQPEYVSAVHATYRKSLWKHNISESGWTPHDLGKTRFPDGEGDPVGEHASCGDVAQIAMWLALHDGYTELLDDTERLIRARLLPSQIVDSEDARSRGAWGVYSHPFGRGAILDVIAAVLHSFVDFHRHVVTRSSDGAISVNLHFDMETESVSMRANRQKDGCLWIEIKQAGQVRIRIPSWAARAKVALKHNGESLTPSWESNSRGGQFLRLPEGEVRAGDTLEVMYDLPERETIERMPNSRREFRLYWRGDEVSASEPDVPIYAARESD